MQESRNSRIEIDLIKEIESYATLQHHRHCLEPVVLEKTQFYIAYLIETRQSLVLWIILCVTRTSNKVTHFRVHSRAVASYLGRSDL